jgi:hypothetical protein
MIVPAGVKVHLALGYTDMRKGLDAQDSALMHASSCKVRAAAWIADSLGSSRSGKTMFESSVALEHHPLLQRWLSDHRKDLCRVPARELSDPSPLAIPASPTVRARDHAAHARRLYPCCGADCPPPAWRPLPRAIRDRQPWLPSTRHERHRYPRRGGQSRPAAGAADRCSSPRQGIQRPHSAIDARRGHDAWRSRNGGSSSCHCGGSSRSAFRGPFECPAAPCRQWHRFPRHYGVPAPPASPGCVKRIYENLKRAPVLPERRVNSQQTTRSIDVPHAESALVQVGDVVLSHQTCTGRWRGPSDWTSLKERPITQSPPTGLSSDCPSWQMGPPSGLHPELHRQIRACKKALLYRVFSKLFYFGGEGGIAAQRGLPYAPPENQQREFFKSAAARGCTTSASFP